MKFSLKCHNKDCGALLTADTEEELVRLGQQHAQAHGHHNAPSDDQVLARIRKHNPQAAAEPGSAPPIVKEPSSLTASSTNIEYTTQIASLRGFGRVEKVFIGGRWVGMVYRDPHPPAEVDELWMAYHQGGHAVDSRQAAIAQVLEYAAANPGFKIHD